MKRFIITAMATLILGIGAIQANTTVVPPRKPGAAHVMRHDRKEVHRDRAKMHYNATHHHPARAMHNARELRHDKHKMHQHKHFFHRHATR